MGRTGQNGLRLAGRYRLVERLGTGGMSVVWRGYDETLGRSVAVKVLSPRHADDVSFRDRLRQEALAAARLCHPHITGIFDFGEAPLTDRLTVPYVVMQLNDGESVAARLSRQGPLAWRDAVTMATEVAAALATAHARGLVHRDVTPANVMLTGAGAKVVDFGISAIVGQCDAGPDGSLLGTPAYLAPERLAGSQVAAATDVYALGLLLYRALTGRLPWPAETTAEALRAHLYAAPDPLPDLPGMPPEVAEVCLRCLAKTPGDRPSAAEAARALGGAVGIQPIIPPVRERRDDAPPPVRATVAAPSAGSAASGRGLPGRSVVPALRAGFRVLRLRAGLKAGALLRRGGDLRPLGGGLFATGGAARPTVRGTRHRLPVALVTTALLTAGGVGWATTRDTAEGEQAQAAGAAPAAGLPARASSCAVRYQLRRDSGRKYEALLTVVTTEELGRSPWRVQFSYPGSQRLTGAPKAVVQKGRKVVARGSGKLRSFTLRGAYQNFNPLPLAFSLDGRRCHAEVLSTVAAAEPAAGDGQARRGGPPRRSSERQKRAGGAEPAPELPPPALPRPPPTSRKGSGFSLALR
jgi:eukaryotic-like serine/threonine-protein kinase